MNWKRTKLLLYGLQKLDKDMSIQRGIVHLSLPQWPQFPVADLVLLADALAQILNTSSLQAHLPLVFVRVESSLQPNQLLNVYKVSDEVKAPKVLGKETIVVVEAEPYHYRLWTLEYPGESLI